MKKQDTDFEDELRSEYDLTPLLKDAVRGKYVERYRQSLEGEEKSMTTLTLECQPNNMNSYRLRPHRLVNRCKHLLIALLTEQMTQAPQPLTEREQVIAALHKVGILTERGS